MEDEEDGADDEHGAKRSEDHAQHGFSIDRSKSAYAVGGGGDDDHCGEEHHGAVDVGGLAFPDGEGDQDAEEYDAEEGYGHEFGGIEVPQEEVGGIDTGGFDGDFESKDNHGDGGEGPNFTEGLMEFVFGFDNQNGLDEEEEYPGRHGDAMEDEEGFNG